jgi:DNA-binding NarL/FixJ family response regulator
MYDKLEFMEGLSTKQLLDFATGGPVATGRPVVRDIEKDKEDKMKAVINGIEIEGTSDEFAQFFGNVEASGGSVVKESQPEIPVEDPKKKKRYHAWTDSDRDKVIELRRQGVKFEDIAIAMDRALSSVKAQYRNTVYAERKASVVKEPIVVKSTPSDLDAPTPRKDKRDALSRETKIKAVEMLKKGTSVKEVASLLGLNRTTVQFLKYNMDFFDSIKSDD